MNERNENADIALMTEIATLYYTEGETQEVIANRLGISRVKAGRLLKRAQAEGIVDVRVRQHPAVSAEIEQALKRRFGIKRALIALDHADADVQRANVASLVADHLSRQLSDGAIVAVGMGRNVGAVADNVFEQGQRQCSFVCAIGGSVRAGEYMNPDHICRRLAIKFGGDSETLYAPALVQNLELRDAMYENPTIRQTLDRARRADLALIGIGDLSENSNMVRMGWFTPQETAEARLSGTVGDMMGYDFIDIYGRPSLTPMQGRVIGLTITDLARIPDVIAIAAENTKAAGILGALRTGVIDTLATSVTNAHTILRLDEATRVDDEPA
ncbi:sugar-binding transcriptional regulator [Salinicola sp. LHM]|uniref:sugar-binding transcriptional regulator n=1 Tax=Salinicola TaxID=404432 RepID=UPI0008DD117F|nr:MULTISPECIES: sugar-binding transcriptional regulator [Salinicola]MDF3920523.1 sugar-binding transcriptional regulator [Salinicola salarius]OHZ01812.1 DNA-binding protein [Salinicola sp. MIT1003]WQH32554.1 sugar-binding transcriptional regulator [Salinicola sp. LHM]